MNEIKDIHNPFKAWLDKNHIPYHRNRPDKKTTAIKGDPDFLCTLANRCIYIECKVPGKKPSKDQEKRIAYLRQAGNTVKIAHSVEDCIYAVETWLGVVNAAGEAPESVAVASDPERTKSDEASGASLPTLYIKNWQQTPWVCQEKLVGEGPDLLIRPATPRDLMNIQRR